MSTNLPDRRRAITDLTKPERVEMAQTLFIEKAKHGTSFNKLGEKYNITTSGVRTLIEEYGLYLSQTRNHSKEANIAVYDYIISKSIDILDNPEGVPAIVWAKSFEGAIQSLTRKDKLLGHEAPSVNINAGQETLMDLVQKKFGAQGENAQISPTDTAILGEQEILEGEVVDDAEDVEESTEDRPY